MDNTIKLADVFAEALGIERSRINDELSYNTIAEWDSVAHMQLIAALEDAFEIMLDTDEILDMSSFAKARSIITGHGIEF